MGLISTMARCMRNNRLSRRLSTQSIKLPDDDSDDLIKPYSETASLRADSIASTSTMVHHSFHEPVLPSESPVNRMQIRTDNINTRTLFDASHTTPTSTATSPTDGRAAGALSRSQYPVFKLDMCQGSFEPRKLAEPLETGTSKKIHNPRRRVGEMGGEHCPSESSTDVEKDVDMDSPGKYDNSNVKEKKGRRRSMKCLLMKHCGLNSPRSSLSFKTRKSPASASPKWLETHLWLRGKRRTGFWDGSAMGRPF